MATLGAMLALLLLTPMISGMLGDKLLPVALVSSPMQCLFLLIMDNGVEDRISVNGPGGMTLDDLRGLSLLYSLLYAVGAALMYRWALRPAGPWKRDEPLPPIGGYTRPVNRQPTRVSGV